MAQYALRKRWVIEADIQIIRTSGDERVSRSENAGSRGESVQVTSSGSLDFHADDLAAGKKGMFTAELERALIEKRIDVAVHSAKDLPSEMDGALTIAATLSRAAVEDLLLRKSAALTPITSIATGSVRRQRQWRGVYPNARIVPLRGNVPTRLRKFIESDWDAIILARAGLERLGFLPPQFEFAGHRICAEILPIEKFVPAGGQGIIALQTRAGDFSVHEIVSAVDDPQTHACLRAEREVLRLLHGDCDLPVGVHARFVNAEMELRVQVFGDSGVPKMAVGVGSEPTKLVPETFEKLEWEQEHG